MNSQPHGPSAYDRERERDRELEEQHRQRALQQQEDLAQREREHHERQERERQQREQYQPAPAHQNNTGTIPIHQPVANRLPTAIHSPGGLLANHGGAPPPPSAPLGAPNGPGNAFGGPLHSETNRSIQQNAQNAAAQQQQHQLFGSNLLHVATQQNGPLGVAGGPAAGLTHQQLQQQQQEVAARLIPFGGPMTPHQHPGAPMGQPGQPGQQPILNDALSYLDQVKVQFADQPDVYNKFLDIMKDFKSQAIDTPGVINRVSELFAGHPNLIQGFNTFLPPGYRIECGTGSDPNTIRVTTPMGTTVQSITGSGRALPDGIGGTGANSYQFGAQRANNWQQPQNSIESPEGVFSPAHQPAGPAYGQNQSLPSTYEAQQQANALHQQQQRGVSQLSNAVNLSITQPARNTHTPTPAGQGVINGSAQASLEKRGPVEFNHAISYVNKIKNRFQDKPEIYKQFLEILQTYQRESKPIQDVYAQVTELFKSAPDLLEDFKQFLPESAAHAKAAAKAAEDNLAAMASSQAPMSNARGAEPKLPQMGNFPTPSAAKENKRGKRPLPAGPPAAESAARGMGMGHPAKRLKTTHSKPLENGPAVSPTLTPAMPEPLAPTSRADSVAEDMAFLDRVKKYVGNKSTFSEFMKLCNMFSNDIINRNDFVYRISSYLGGNLDLSSRFKIFIGSDSPNGDVDNAPSAPTGRVALSNCRALGPSYRLLPKRERLKSCSGRDEMCNEVLNDDWASHPTWASEDSGFVAHRKNQFEEGLHRIEEERHDYDFNVEANAKVIQLLEPIAQSLLTTSQAERERMSLFQALGSQSQSLYRRVLKKVYGVERGPDVVHDLFKDAAAVLPIVLARLKQKDEEWRFTQREWEKVWHAQTQAMHLRSLDHMGNQVKTADKKLYSQKTLVDNIKTKHEQQRLQRAAKQQAPRHQYAYEFSDQDIIVDLVRLMIVFVISTGSHNTNERRRIIAFFEKFIAAFFDIPANVLAERINGIDRGSPDDDFEDVAPNELPNGRGRRQANGKRGDLRRGVLEKGRNGIKSHVHKEGSVTGSKESSPDVESIVDEEMVDATEDQAITEVTTERWTGIPRAIAIPGSESLPAGELEIKVDQPFVRESYSLYCNQTIFHFFSVFQLLYQRFKDLKQSEEEVKAAVQRSKVEKPAHKIGLLETQSMLTDLEEGETYYGRTLLMAEDYIKGEIDESKYQDYLRNYYLMKGWQIYTLMDLLRQLSQRGASCSTNDAKEKSPDLIEQFLRDREMRETSCNTEITLRKQADKYIKDGELFLIRWYPEKHEATVQWMPKDQTTWNLDDMERKERWQYYVSSYIRVEPTEGVPRQRLSASVLAQHLPSSDADVEDSSSQRKPLVWNEDLSMRICVNTYKIVYDGDSGTEYFIYADKELGGNVARERLQKAEEARNQKLHEKFSTPEWMKKMSQDDIQKINQDFQNWVKEGVLPTTVN